MHSIARQKSRFVDCVVTVITQRVSATAERIARERCSFPEICNFVGTRSEKNTFFDKVSSVLCAYTDSRNSQWCWWKGYTTPIRFRKVSTVLSSIRLPNHDKWVTAHTNKIIIFTVTTRRGSWHFLRSYCRNNQDCLVTALPYTVGFNVSFSTI